MAQYKSYTHVLRIDKDEDVRAVVAELGYGLDVLINDKNEFVRLTAQKKKTERQTVTKGVNNMNEHVRIANALRETSANIREIQNKGYETELEINEQLANEMLELERILGWDVTRPEGFAFERLAQLIDPTCTLIYRETTPRGADECDMDWEWRCSNCNVNLSEQYNDLDINTFEELGLSYCPNCRCRIINTDM